MARQQTGSHLFAKSLDICFRQLLTGHQALDPTIDSWDRWRITRGRHGVRLLLCTNVLHVCVHDATSVCLGVVKREKVGADEDGSVVRTGGLVTAVGVV